MSRSSGSPRSDGRSLLGREIPAGALGELGGKLGLELGAHLPPDELAATVLRTGRPMPFGGPEPLTLKRALVNGSQRLELAGFSAARLRLVQGAGLLHRDHPLPDAAVRAGGRRRAGAGAAGS